MHSLDALSKAREAGRRLGVEEINPYWGAELVPSALDSLATWDVSLHAKREQERLNAAARRR